MCINYKIDSLSTVVYTLAYLAIETIAAVELEKQKKIPKQGLEQSVYVHPSGGKDHSL